MRESDGRMVHVNDVQNGRKCGCICPVCKSPLIARQGKIRTWHFAHAAEVNCDSTGETTLHLAAKQVLKDLDGRILIPKEVIRKTGWPSSTQSSGKGRTRLNGLMTHIVPERRASESIVRVEPQDWAQQGFRPDAVLEKDGSQLLIEIRVTHEVDAEKRRRIQKAGLGVIEIDLSNTDRNTAPDDLTRLIVSEAPRYWLVTGRKEKCKRLEAEFTKILEDEASRFNRMILRALTRDFYVNACPRRNEPGFESVYIYQCLDCHHNGGYPRNFADTPLWEMLDERIRHGGENSVLCARRDNSYQLPTEKQKTFVRGLASADLERENGLIATLPKGWEQDRKFCQQFIDAHPDCNGCRKKMVLRRNGKEQLFWGCRDYPSCRATTRYVPKPVLKAIMSPHEDERYKVQTIYEKSAPERAAPARPETAPNSLSQRATPFSLRSKKG